MFANAWPYVSWKCTAIFSTGAISITASSIGKTLPEIMAHIIIGEPRRETLNEMIKDNRAYN
jgi:hypothetical protein